MHIRKITARNMADALAQVERECGTDALVVDTRVTAPGDGAPGAVEVWVQAPEPESAPTPGDREMSGRFHALQAQLEMVHAQLETLGQNMQWLGAGSLGTPHTVSPSLANHIAGQIPMSGGITLGEEQLLVALVGPTGVGKTTTLAKLATRMHEQGARVGVITADTTRAGAVEQVATFCERIDVPLVTITGAEDAADALAQMAGCDLVLLDTPGGSPRNEDYLAEISAVLHACDPLETHLVLSASMSTLAVRDAMCRYAPLQPDQVIFTKLDESPSPLEVLPLVAGSGMALSYLGTGTRVPDDLVDASVPAVSRFLIAAEEG